MSDYPPHGPEKTEYINDLAKKVFARLQQEEREEKARDDHGSESVDISNSGTTSSGSANVGAASTPATELEEDDAEQFETKVDGMENTQPDDDKHSDSQASK